MTILFLDEEATTRELRVDCPACKTPQNVIADRNKTVGEICDHCNALFSVRLYPSGMVVVE